ncbi:glycoside hydrolase family 5 protein [Sorangium sp. So ce260]|uniref:glycoside hydrolase family 5 protein n=1 Tax=Sorangium sp. So ce260 TaxID=3133291 RepID=UPI003F5DD183
MLIGCGDSSTDDGSGGAGGAGGAGGGATTGASNSSTTVASGTSASSTSASTSASSTSASTSASSTSASTGTGVVPTDGTPVERHGQLKVKDGNIVGDHGVPVQLKGMSLFWSQWSDYYNANVVNSVADNWKATVIRAAMGIENEGGYLEDAGGQKAKAKAIADAAIAKGLYVILDWHDHNANNHQEQARSYFREVAQTYKNVPNVIFEVFNEPLNTHNWGTVKSYAETVIADIRGQGANNLVIVGSPNWSQDADVAADNPINDPNVAYTLHFYAATHKNGLREKAQRAIDKGLALFVTEWGTCAADGDGALDLGESGTWLDFLDAHNISWANWSLGDKDEACSALRPRANPMGNWTDNDLTESGKWVKARIAE